MPLPRPPAPHGAVGGIGCVPPYRLALDTTSPVSPAAFLAGSTSTVPIGWLVAALRAGLQRLGVTRAELVLCFDGHLHLPGLLQDVAAAAAQACDGFGAFTRVEDAAARLLVDWA